MNWAIAAVFGFLLSISNFINAQDCNFQFSLGNDTTINCGTGLNIQAPEGYNYLWSTGSDLQNIVVSQSGTYSCTITDLQETVVVNGDFSNLYNGFSSEYIIGTGGAFGQLSSEGTYAIASSPSDVHNNFANCFDHTSGNASGSMLVVNGSAFPNLQIWAQDVIVEPNTDYVFSIWGMTAVGTFPAQLNLLVNGTQIGTTFTLSSSTCNWQNYYATWNSGSNTLVEIAIVNQSTSTDGNDFAIDDIEFSPVCIYTDEIVVTVPANPTLTVTENQTICSGESITLSATSSVPGSTFLWQPGSLQGAEITINPTNTAQYTAIATSPQQCNSSPQNVLITVTNPGNYNLNVPETFNTCENVSVLLDVGSAGQGTYSWQPEEFLDDPSLPSPIATVSTDTEFNVTYENACGQEQNASTIVSVGGAVIDMGPDLVMCQGMDYTINLPAGPDYLWEDGSTGNQFTVSETGEYTVETTDALCNATGAIFIEFSDDPELISLDDAVICEGEDLTIDFTNLPYSFLWNDGSTSASKTLSQAGDYSVTASIGNCETTAEFNLSINPLPVFDLGQPTAICPGESLTLLIDIPDVEILWSNGKTTPEIIVDQPGVYSATATLNNCSFSDSFVLGIEEVPEITITGSEELCPNEHGELSATEGDFSYEWNSGGDGSSIPITGGGKYTVEVTDLFTGCVVKAEKFVNELEDPRLEIPESTVVCQGKSIIVSASVGADNLITWSDGSNNSSFLASEPGLYNVSASSVCGVVHKTFEIIERDCTESLFVPNSFTPDGDGLNDNFFAIGTEVKNFEMRIYDRWGKLVFQSNDISEKWNGNYQDNNYYSGTSLYSWMAVVEFNSGTIETYRGSVQIIR